MIFAEYSNKLGGAEEKTSEGPGALNQQDAKPHRTSRPCDRIRRQAASRWACLLALILLQTAAARAATVRETLDQMAAIERQIDALRQGQWEERNRLMQAEGTLQSIEKRLGEQAALHREGEEFLNAYEQQAAREAGQIDRQMQEDLGRVRGARRGLALAGAAILHAGSDGGATEADRLGLLLLWRSQHQTAAVATRRLLRLESRRAQLADGRSEALQTAREHSIFSSLSEQELAEQHRQLAGQIEALQGTIGRSETEIKTLAGRREEMRTLMARLVETESKDTLAPAKNPAAGAEEKLQAALQKGKQAGGIAPVANEGGPLVTRDNAAADDGDGTRQVFWRAEPIGVRALGSGRVVFAEPFAGYRNLLIIDHGNGWRTLYGNLNSCAVKAGAQVAVGDTIGEYQSGQGARVEPFWLEIRQGVTAVRPDQWPALPTQWEHNLFASLPAQK